MIRRDRGTDEEGGDSRERENEREREREREERKMGHIYGETGR